MHGEASKVRLLPALLHSSQQFFDNKVISDLLESLPPQAVLSLRNKYSTEQVERFFRHFEISITRKRAPQYNDAFCRFFAVRDWPGELSLSLDVANRRRLAQNPAREEEDEQDKSVLETSTSSLSRLS